jgi:RNA polymerase sigma-70 factor (ECF subfamily)
MLSDEAFTKCYRETANDLRKYAARVLGNVTEADDIVQEAYLRLLRHPPPTEDARELRPYVFRVASNLIKDGWRRQKRESAAAEMPEPGSESPDMASRMDMSKMFLQLRQRDRQLMWLAYVEGASHREIAASLGLRENSVRVLLARARQKLVKLLGGPEDRGGAR